MLTGAYGAAEVDAALKGAYERGAFAAQSVAHILDQRRRARRAPLRVEPVLPDDPRVRELHVTPHSLATYDVLAKTMEDGDA